jgi:hypothetical protein
MPTRIIQVWYIEVQVKGDPPDAWRVLKDASGPITCHTTAKPVVDRVLFTVVPNIFRARFIDAGKETP